LWDELEVKADEDEKGALDDEDAWEDEEEGMDEDEDGTKEELLALDEDEDTPDEEDEGTEEDEEGVDEEDEGKDEDEEGIDEEENGADDEDSADEEESGEEEDDPKLEEDSGEEEDDPKLEDDSGEEDDPMLEEDSGAEEDDPDEDGNTTTAGEGGAERPMRLMRRTIKTVATMANTTAMPRFLQTVSGETKDRMRGGAEDGIKGVDSSGGWAVPSGSIRTSAMCPPRQGKKGVCCPLCPRPITRKENTRQTKVKRNLGNTERTREKKRKKKIMGCLIKNDFFFSP
jgi:hypothetical protein